MKPCRQTEHECFTVFVLDLALSFGPLSELEAKFDMAGCGVSFAFVPSSLPVTRNVGTESPALAVNESFSLCFLSLVAFNIDDKVTSQP